MTRRKPLRRQVLVITGATSGIGLATARRAAAAGARVVLAARGESDLERIRSDLVDAGGQATCVVADVGSRADVQGIADHAVATFGGFDTWVNVAGLTIYGALRDVSDEDGERLFKTNFWGVVHGSLVAADHFRRCGAGAIITVGSVACDLAFPQQGMYAASKHAVQGFTDALRMELLEEKLPVSVTLLKPNSINSPLPQRARNYMNREPMLPPPIYPPDEVAYAILACAVRPRRDLVVGGGGLPLIAFRRLFPSLYDRIGPAITAFERRSTAPQNPGGALHRPQSGGKVDGTQPGYVMKTSLYTRARLNPGATMAIGGLGALLLAAAARRR